MNNLTKSFAGGLSALAITAVLAAGSAEAGTRMAGSHFGGHSMLQKSSFSRSASHVGAKSHGDARGRFGKTTGKGDHFAKKDKDHGKHDGHAKRDDDWG